MHKQRGSLDTSWIVDHLTPAFALLARAGEVIRLRRWAEPIVAAVATAIFLGVLSWAYGLPATLSGLQRSMQDMQSAQAKQEVKTERLAEDQAQIKIDVAVIKQRLTDGMGEQHYRARSAYSPRPSEP